VGQSLSRPDIRTPATICSGSDIEIVVRSDHGIRGPQDLKGKSVAVLRGSGAEFFLYYYLVFSNISPGDVRIVDLKPSQMVQELAAGSIDAAVFGEPYTTDMARRLPGKAVRWSAQNGQDYYFLLIVKDEFRKKRPAQIEQLLAALLEAEQFVSRYPDQAKALLRQRLGTDAAPFVSAWSHMRHRVQLTQDLVVLMEEEAKWVVRNKRTEAIEIPNYLDYLSFGALEKLKPEAVSIVH
jgi:ABC-type nitrate/sulfonate/bicarbonate transport system substrate-binding protein